MSNTWSYDLYLGRIRLLEDIRAAVVVGEEVGFSPRNPTSGVIGATSSSGTAEEFTDIDEAMTFLVHNGGSLHLWRGDVGILLHAFVWRDPVMPDVSPTDSTSVAGTRLGFDVDNTWYRRSRVDVATNARRLFLDLCVRLNPLCGYSQDEDFWEVLAQGASLHKDIREGRPPSILYWLNYYPDWYTRQVDLTILERFGAFVIPVPTGVVLSFFEYPWELDVQALVRTNQEWQEWLQSHDS